MALEIYATRNFKQIGMSSHSYRPAGAYEGFDPFVRTIRYTRRINWFTCQIHWSILHKKLNNLFGNNYMWQKSGDNPIVLRYIPWHRSRHTLLARKKLHQLSECHPNHIRFYLVNISVYHRARAHVVWSTPSECSTVPKFTPTQRIMKCWGRQKEKTVYKGIVLRGAYFSEPGTLTSAIQKHTYYRVQSQAVSFSHSQQSVENA